MTLTGMMSPAASPHNMGIGGITGSTEMQPESTRRSGSNVSIEDRYEYYRGDNEESRISITNDGAGLSENRECYKNNKPVNVEYEYKEYRNNSEPETRIDNLNTEALSLPRIGRPSFLGTKEDPTFDRYIKTQSPHSNATNRHQLYFKSLNRQRKIKSLEVYKKYLNLDDKAKDFKYEGKIPSFKRNFPPLNKKSPQKTPQSDDSTTTTVPTKTTSQLEPALSSTSVSQSSKKLPKEFMECDIDDLINLVARMLQSLINLNDKSVPTRISNPESSNDSKAPNTSLTRYHSRIPPGISVKSYLARLTNFNNFTPATLLSTIYYIDLLSHHYQPYFTLNSWTVHRFLLVGTMLSQKSMEDFFYTNDHYAKVGGVALSELNCLELDFLLRVQWKCIPSKKLENGRDSIRFMKEVLDLYYYQLIQLMGRNSSECDELIYLRTDEYDSDVSEEEMTSETFAEANTSDNRKFYLNKANEEHEFGMQADHPSIHRPDVNYVMYNSQGFSINGSSSPHLKRRYPET